jgi:hypothetical protein
VKKIIATTGTADQAASAAAEVAKELRDQGNDVSGDFQVEFFEHLRLYKVTIWYEEGAIDARLKGS